MKSLYIIVLLILLLAFVLGIFIPEVQNIGIQISFNTLVVLDSFFRTSGKLNPLVAWTITFAIFGFFIGLIQSVKKNKLSKWFFIISFVGIAWLVWNLYSYTHLSSFKSSRDIRESALYQNIKTQKSYYQSSLYIKEFPEGKFIREVKGIQENALWDSARIANNYSAWKLYNKVFCGNTSSNIRCIQSRRSIDRLLWNEVSRINNKEGYEKYVKECPNGNFVADARRKLARFGVIQTEVADNNAADSQPQENINVDNSITDAAENISAVSEENTTTNAEETANSLTGIRGVNNSPGETIIPETTFGSLSLDGRDYFGEVKNNKPNGNGKETFPDNSVLAGKYIDGQREGEFMLTEANGHVKRQIFRNGIKTEEFEVGETTMNGIKYKGDLRNGLAHGKGKEFFPDNSILEGYYKEGKRDGVFTLIKSNGDREIQIFKDGNRTN